MSGGWPHAAAAPAQRAAERLLPVMEVFGPTIQGEGPAAGQVVSFVRFGTCDYRCSWCDSMHAVDPALVHDNATRMGASEIVEALEADERRQRSGRHVVLSGGNPALWDLGELVSALRRAKWSVHVETQGSVWREWLGSVQRLIVSPKPPSSGMVSELHARQTRDFMRRASQVRPLVHGALKIVVFDEDDLAWAAAYAEHYPTWPLYLSAGTTPKERWLGPLTDEVIRGDVCDRYRWLCEAVVGRFDERVRVLPQLHVLAWGHQLGR